MMEHVDYQRLGAAADGRFILPVLVGLKGVTTPKRVEVKLEHAYDMSWTYDMRQDYARKKKVNPHQVVLTVLWDEAKKI